jgi:hypothetical protein
MAGWSMDPLTGNAVQQNTSTTGQSTTTSSQQTKGSQSVSSSQQNMTPTALTSLDQLILQLMETPNISDQQLNLTAPLPAQRAVPVKSSYMGVPVYGAVTYEWYDPLTGQTLSADQAQKLTVERQTERDRLSAEAGVTRGGTATMQANQLARDETVSNLLQGQQDYSKEAAFSDAQVLVDQFMRQFGEENVAAITRASEGAGTSASSVRSLLMSDAQARAAEAAGALGVQTAIGYGGVSADFANVLAGLTASDPVTDALLAALGIAKGAVSYGSSVTNTSSSTTGRSTVEQSQQSMEDIIRQASAPKPGLDYVNYGSPLERGATY